MELKELKIICNALWEYKRFCLEKNESLLTMIIKKCKN